MASFRPSSQRRIGAGVGIGDEFAEFGLGKAGQGFPAQQRAVERGFVPNRVKAVEAFALRQACPCALGSIWQAARGRRPSAPLVMALSSSSCSRFAAASRVASMPVSSSGGSPANPWRRAGHPCHAFRPPAGRFFPNGRLRLGFFLRVAGGATGSAGLRPPPPWTGAVALPASRL